MTRVLNSQITIMHWAQEAALEDEYSVREAQYLPKYILHFALGLCSAYSRVTVFRCLRSTLVHTFSATKHEIRA